MTQFQTAFQHIDEHIRRQMDHYQIPGAALAVIDRERTLHLSTHGLANIDSGEPVRPEHLFETGSIGKSFTAIALLQLVEERRIDLHAPVTDYLPWFEVGGNFDSITIHHLLTHTAGIIGINDVLTDKLYDVWALRNLDAAWQPGNRYHYSNVGYKTLGLVLERIERAGYGEIIQRRILDRLGMPGTEPETRTDMRDKLVTGYLPYYDDRPWLPHHGMTPAAWLEIASGEGCMAAPVGEQATYLRALMNRDGRLLSGASWDLMTSKHIEVEPDHWYGYGIDRDEIGGHTLIGHGGEMPGHKCWMFGDLDTGIGFVIMINCIAPVFDIALGIHEALAAVAAGDPIPEMPETIDRRIIENAADLAGAYVDQSNDASGFELEARNQGLVLRSGGTEGAVWRLEDESLVADHPAFSRLPLRFAEKTDANAMIRHGAARYRRSEDSGLSTSSGETARLPDDIQSVIGHYRTYGSVFTNFRIMPGWGDELLFVSPTGEEWHLHRIGQSIWRAEDMPETVRFDTFVEGRAARAIFSGCDYYRTFTE